MICSNIFIFHIKMSVDPDRLTDYMIYTFKKYNSFSINRPFIDQDKFREGLYIIVKEWLDKEGFWFEKQYLDMYTADTKDQLDRYTTPTETTNEGSPSIVLSIMSYCGSKPYIDLPDNKNFCVECDDAITNDFQIVLVDFAKEELLGKTKSANKN